jgi:hypothetical protein
VLHARFQKCLRLLALAAILSWSVAANADPANYLFIGGDRVADWHDLLARSDIAGVQVVYDWRSLEPAKDRYDFSTIETDLASASAQHRKLFIQI